MRRLLAFLLLSLAAASAYAVPTVEDVQHAVHRADYAAAQSMLHEVIAAQPENARAHYMLSELLAHDGKLAEAKKEAALAQKLDPAIHFTTPARFKEYLSELDGGGVRPITARRNVETPIAPPPRSGGGSSVMWILLLLIGGGVVLMLMRRRPNDVPPGYGGYANTGGVPPGNGPYPPGYPGAGYPPGYGQPPGSGMGGRVAAGLGGIAAGMVAEHLIEEALDRHHGNANAADFSDRSLPPSNPLEDRPIDFGTGNNDWSDSSGGGDSGGGDMGGFDSGSGGNDWS